MTSVFESILFSRLSHNLLHALSKVTLKSLIKNNWILASRGFVPPLIAKMMLTQCPKEQSTPPHSKHKYLLLIGQMEYL